MQLRLQSLTWDQDRDSLFNHSAKQLSVDSFVFNYCQSPIAVYRNKSARKYPSVIVIEINKAKNIAFQQYELIAQFKIRYHSKDFVSLQFQTNIATKAEQIYFNESCVEDYNKAEDKDQVYFVAKRPTSEMDQSNGVKLEVGQTIKLGKVTFFVSQIRLRGKTSTSKDYYNKIYAKKIIKKYVQNKAKQNQSNLCRYCMVESDDKDDFLFNPCNCSGSCSTVHIGCLVKWIQTKVKKTIFGSMGYFNFGRSACEICKAQFPAVVETNEGKVIELLPFQKSNGDYIILQGACELSKRIVNIKNVPQKGFNIGRGQEAQMRVEDCTVSRKHATIRQRESGFYIYDRESKFGTLIRQQRMRVYVGMGCQQRIQIGRTVIIFHLIDRQQSRRERYASHLSNGMRQLW